MITAREALSPSIRELSMSPQPALVRFKLEFSWKLGLQSNSPGYRQCYPGRSFLICHVNQTPAFCNWRRHSGKNVISPDRSSLENSFCAISRWVSQQLFFFFFFFKWCFVCTSVRVQNKGSRQSGRKRINQRSKREIV